MVQAVNLSDRLDKAAGMLQDLQYQVSFGANGLVCAAQTAFPRPISNKRVVITTIGSLGDLHPYIAIARELQSRGHEAILATSECYRRKIENLNIGFRPVRPDSAWIADPEKM